MSCTCYGGHNPGCEDHGLRTGKAEVVTVAPTGEDAKAYDKALERLKGVLREMKQDGEKPGALMLVVIDETARVFCPMIIMDDDAKAMLPSLFDMIGSSLRRKLSN